MSVPSTRNAIGIAIVLLASILICSPKSFAQDQQQQQQPQQQSKPPSLENLPANGAAAQPAAAAPKPADPEEEKAYKDLTDTKVDDADKRIQLGEQYLQKYPNGKYEEQVYSALTIAEESKQDLPKMYADADKALALNPDDVTILVLVGWVIPHNSANDPDAESRLDKGEHYETHALTLLAALPKPANMTDDQFAKAKAQAESQAHSGLGLIYFRRAKYDEAVAEFKQSIAKSESPDPTDYYVMGVCLTHLSRFTDAIDAYQKCGQIPGGLQDRCKQMVDQTKKQAATELQAPK
ncbi:MAG: tetratricopeptide repeat protein [Candidatus Acidiferrales bacterium]